MGQVASFVGYALGSSTDDGTVNFEEDLSQYDKLSRDDLINLIKYLKPKNVNLPDNYGEQLKDIELENVSLLPMSIELYKKLYAKFGELKFNDNNTKKKQFFVKPKFDVDVVRKTINSEVVDISTSFINNLYKVEEPMTCMKTSDITVMEYNESFNENINKKDMMGISKKMLRDLPNYLRTRYLNTFNLILNGSFSVKDHCIGKSSYMYKAAKRGSVTDINSFRQIVTVPNVVNQFHRILTLRLNNYMHLNKYIDVTIQKGGVAGQKFAIFEQYYKVKNVFKDATINKTSCVVMFLDVSNAFGNLNLNNLYKILELYSVDQKFINYIKTFYENFEYYVDTGNIKTELFKWKQGLIQGCSLSPLLFIIALNYILTFLDKDYKDVCGYKFSGSNVKILLTAFVDDITIVCKDVASLSLVYRKLTELLTMLGLPVNKAKTAIMVTNDKTPLTGELAQIQKVNVYKYLGEYVSNDGTCTESYVQVLKGVSRKLKSIDLKNISNTEKAKLFTSLVVPWLQRRTLCMYDIKNTNRLKIVAIIKPYIEKWEIKEDINIFTNVKEILNNSPDAVITETAFLNEEIDDDLEKNIDIANYVLRDSSVKIEYSQIDDEFAIDAELEEYDKFVEQ